MISHMSKCMNPPTAIPDSSDPEFTCLARVARTMGVHPTTATRMAAAGQIRVSAVPGRRVHYSLADARHLVGQLGVTVPA